VSRSRGAPAARASRSTDSADRPILDTMTAPALPVAGFAEAELTAAHFAAVSRIAYEIAGIQLREGKEGLVRSRLAKRLRALGLASYDDYLARVAADAGELSQMVDALTTNKTNFFREPAHFDFLRDRLLPALGPRPVRVWSAGCSTGEEPYTLAMVLRDALPEAALRETRVLATDISPRVLAHARAGRYAEAVAEEVPAELRRRHFTRAPGGAWDAGPGLRALIAFARLNLMGAWPMRGPFDAIFCRNVMIYFDKPTQQTLVARFLELLAPGGYLFVGHSESLSGIAHGYTYVQPAVYRR
jgi:chemotaxis protein methyltransferase CheR